jgi:hypothetical protein
VSSLAEQLLAFQAELFFRESLIRWFEYELVCNGHAQRTFPYDSRKDKKLNCEPGKALLLTEGIQQCLRWNLDQFNTRIEINAGIKPKPRVILF